MNVPDMDVQEFISLSVSRRLAVTFGEDDPALGEPWSARLNSTQFLIAFQELDHSWRKLNSLSIQEGWRASALGR